jgi:uncharacterized coiled-coil DUF342 family protein
MEGIINNLSKLDYEEYYDTSDYEIRKYIEDYELEVKEYNENFTQKSKIQNELKNEINIIEPQIYKLVLDIDEIENEFNQVENSLKNATNKVNIKDEKLKNILSENFNLLENKKKVNDVETRFSFLKIRLEELIEKKSQNPH